MRFLLWLLPSLLAAQTCDIVLQRGMVLALEPNACLGDHRVNIGGTIIITDEACEELNTIPTRLTHK